MRMLASEGERGRSAIVHQSTQDHVSGVNVDVIGFFVVIPSQRRRGRRGHVRTVFERTVAEHDASPPPKFIVRVFSCCSTLQIAQCVNLAILRRSATPARGVPPRDARYSWRSLPSPLLLPSSLL